MLYASLAGLGRQRRHTKIECKRSMWNRDARGSFNILVKFHKRIGYDICINHDNLPCLDEQGRKHCTYGNLKISLETPVPHGI